MAARKANPGRDMVKVDGVPNYLVKYSEDDTSMDTMEEYRIVPRLKIIQGTTSAELKEMFQEGSVIVTPGNIFVAEKKKDFLFVPVFFYTEFCHWSDILDSESPVIVARDFDPSSELARKARNPEMRKEGYGEIDRKTQLSKYEYTFAEHLNFVGIVYDGSAKGTEAVLSFNRGTFGKGRIFISQIRMRKTPLWSQVWCLTTYFDDRKQGQAYWSWKTDNPKEGIQPIIAEDEVEIFKEAHESIKEAHSKRILITDHTSEKDVEEPIEIDETKSDF